MRQKVFRRIELLEKFRAGLQLPANKPNIEQELDELWQRIQDGFAGLNDQSWLREQPEINLAGNVRELREQLSQIASGVGAGVAA